MPLTMMMVMKMINVACDSDYNNYDCDDSDDDKIIASDRDII